jgi:hypothetical protein
LRLSPDVSSKTTTITRKNTESSLLSRNKPSVSIALKEKEKVVVVEEAMKVVADVVVVAKVVVMAVMEVVTGASRKLTNKCSFKFFLNVFFYRNRKIYPSFIGICYDWFSD